MSSPPLQGGLLPPKDKAPNKNPDIFTIIRQSSVIFQDVVFFNRHGACGDDRTRTLDFGGVTEFSLYASQLFPKLGLYFFPKVERFTFNINRNFHPKFFMPYPERHEMIFWHTQQVFVRITTYESKSH